MRAAGRARRRASQLLDAAGCRAIEPGLNPETALHAGIYSAGRRGRQLPRSSRTCCARRRSARRAFRFNTQVEQIVPARSRAGRAHAPRDARDERVAARAIRATGRTTQPSRRASEPSFDAVVVCAALDSPPLLRAARPAPAAGSRSTATRSRRRCATTSAPAPRAARGADGRTLQGGDQPPRQARARGRQRRDRRPARAAERAAPSARSYKVLDDWFPGVARAQPGAALERRAADAARRAAGARAERLPKASGSTSAMARSGWALACGSARAGRRPMAGRRRRSTSKGSASSGCGAARDVSRALARSAHDARIDARPAARRCSASPRRARDRGRRRCATLPAFTLMARAGDAVARLALALAPHAERVWVARRPGQQRRRRPRGRDAPARAAARTHASCSLGDRGRAARRCARGAARARAQPACRSATGRRASADAPDLAIDALLGLGASRAPSGAMAAAIGIAELAAAACRCSRSTCRPASTPTRGQPLGDACVVADAHAGLLDA